MPFSFPASPSTGDKSTQNGREYEWSGYAWEIVATPASLNASVITAGTLDAARLPLATTIAAGAVIVGTGLGVSSGTVSVSYGTTSGTACQGNDSRLSDTRTPTDGSVTTAKLANDAVTYAKLQNVSATDRLLGRSSAGSGDVEEVTCSAFGRSLIDDADAAAARTTLSVQPTASPAFTGTFACGDTVNIGTASATNTIINVGNGATGNRFALIDIIGDTTYTDYGLRIGRDNNGANGQSIIHHRGTGEIAIVAIDAGSVQLGTSSTARLTISSAGVSTFSGQLLVTAGSGSSGSYKPGIAVSGDDDTGLQQVGGANTISLVTAGSERLRISSTGAVGISTDPVSGFPLAVFSFATSDANKATLLLNGTVGSGQSFAGIRFTHNVFSTGWAADILCVDTGNFGGILSFRTSAAGSATATPTERLKIDASGNVGVGNIVPTHRIDCNGEFRLRGAGASTEAGKLHLYWVSSTNRATWTTDASGNALIETGSSAPAERFRVGVNGRSQFFAASEKYGVQLNNGSTANGPFIGSDGADILTISTSGGAERMRVKATGSVRFVPLSADPSTGNEAGDVYYNSSTNKLRVYNGTSWVDLH